MIDVPTSLQFFATLQWLDGRNFLSTVEPYRRRLFTRALDTYREDGMPLCNFVVDGRGKKNNKSTDLVASAFYSMLFRDSHQGADCYILANDEDQASDDLGLAKKLVECNAVLSNELTIYNKEIRRNDGKGTMRVLPAKDVAGAHGKTGVFIGFDEVHGFRTYDMFEAMTQDPTRYSMTWVTSYDTIYNAPGVPLFDFKKLGMEGSDPRMIFSWYSGDHCSDPEFADLEPELRANPSIGSWPDGRKYLEQQRRRLPTSKFRRLHLNLPGAPTGAWLDQQSVLDAIVYGRKILPPRDGTKYMAFVDMSGGSGDDATLAIGHRRDKTRVIDLLVSQSGKPPFNPRQAVSKFAGLLRQYGLSSVHGDDYAGETFKADFLAEGIVYKPVRTSKSDLYEGFEPALNAGEVELLDLPKLHEQLLTLIVMGGGKIDHQPGGHDDWANAVAGCVVVMSARQPLEISDELLARSAQPLGGLYPVGFGLNSLRDQYPAFRPFGWESAPRNGVVKG